MNTLFLYNDIRSYTNRSDCAMRLTRPDGQHPSQVCDPIIIFDLRGD